MNEIRTVTNHGHHMQVIGTGDDQRHRVICPDGGKNCECWIECQQDHPCDCGSDEHGHNEHCDPGCDENHALECDEWLWRDGMLHGDYHQSIGGMVCVKDSGCWMPEWDIEFDQVQYRDLYPPGLYEFDYEDPDDDMGGLLYIVAMRPVSAAMESCTPHGCQCACHKPDNGIQVSHVVPCCFASDMTVEIRTEWRCEICGAEFDDQDEAWDHWRECDVEPRREDDPGEECTECHLIH